MTTKGVLDYFGTTVNMKARLKAQAGGGEIVLSEAVFGLEASKLRLAERACSEGEALLAGFSAPIRFLRVR